MRPHTCYARSGDISVAFQVVGDGPLDRDAGASTLGERMDDLAVLLAAARIAFATVRSAVQPLAVYEGLVDETP